MILTQELAQPILDKLLAVLENPVHIIDHRGLVMASTQAERVGTLHQGALRAIRERSNLRVDSNESAQLAGTRMGITLPLEFHGEVLGAVGLTGDPDSLWPVASVIKVAVMSLIEQVHLTRQADTQRRAMEHWADSLFDREAPDAEALQEQARVIGVDMKRVCSIIVVRVKPAARNHFPTQEQMVRQLLSAVAGIHFYATMGAGLYLFAVRAKSRGECEALDPVFREIPKNLLALGHESWLGVGQPGAGVEGYRQGYFDALHSVRVLERLGGDKRVIYYHEHRLYWLLECVPAYARQGFCAGLLGRDTLDPTQTETLQAYFDRDGSVAEAASALHVHRNTLIFRLNKLRELYGLDPRSLRDAVAWQMILYLQKFPRGTPETE